MQAAQGSYHFFCFPVIPTPFHTHLGAFFGPLDESHSKVLLLEKLQLLPLPSCL